jgi:general secretion pathway protein F
MPQFQYKATRSDGQILEGRLEGADRQSIARQLQSQGAIPIQIQEAGAAKPATGAPTPRRSWSFGRSSGQIVDFFTLELSTLLRAGLPLSQALETMSELSEDAAVKELIQSINTAVRSGRALSDALHSVDAGFDDFYCNMVRAGESSGALGIALERLVTFRTARRQLFQSITSALIYPAILLVLAIAAVAVMLAFVVPQFTQMFADAGRDLPLLTRIVAGAGELVTNWWWLMLLMGGAAAWWLRRDWRSPAGRARWDAWLLNSRIVGPLVQKIATARFARTLSTLLENGVHLVPALEISKQIAGNVVMSRALSRVSQRVREGMGLAGPLAETRVLPAMATQLIRVGEKSGRLEMMLGQVAEIYEREVETTMKRLLTFAEPVIIITIALVITVIILSVVLMILESNDLAF